MNLTDIRIAVISLILCGLFQQSAAADTIDCDNRRLHYLDWVQKYFELADAVFLGKVLDEETPPRPTRRPLPVPENGASNMAELLEIIEAGQTSTPQPERLQSATFEIIRTWKGPAGPTIVAKASLHSDDTGSYAVLMKDHSYLVFAFQSDDKEPVHISPSCTFSESSKETPSKVRVLDALTKKLGE
jgi:hypothetical protein